MTGPRIIDVPGEPSIAEWLGSMREAERAKADRARARAMFTAAGRPIPAWAMEPEGTGPMGPSAAIESEDELLHNMPPSEEP